MDDNEQPWHSLPIEKIVSVLNVDTVKGLNEIEVSKRLSLFGKMRLKLSSKVLSGYS